MKKNHRFERFIVSKIISKQTTEREIDSWQAIKKQQLNSPLVYVTIPSNLLSSLFV